MRNLPRNSKETLIAAARRACHRAIAPHSKFRVGAALLTKDGQIIVGANVESASYGLTCCAERIALFKALTDGKAEFIALAIVARQPQGPLPCGACRQVLAEFAPDIIVVTADYRQPKSGRTFRLSKLLPYPFQLRAEPDRRATGA